MPPSLVDHVGGVLVAALHLGLREQVQRLGEHADLVRAVPDEADRGVEREHGVVGLPEVAEVPALLHERLRLALGLR